MGGWRRRHFEAMGPKRDFVEALFAAQDGYCHYCGKRMTKKTRYRNRATLDHVVPRSRGGATARDNLVLACLICNLKKGNKLLDELAPGWNP